MRFSGKLCLVVDRIRVGDYFERMACRMAVGYIIFAVRLDSVDRVTRLKLHCVPGVRRRARESYPKDPSRHVQALVLRALFHVLVGIRGDGRYKNATLPRQWLNCIS